MAAMKRPEMVLNLERRWLLICCCLKRIFFWGQDGEMRDDTVRASLGDCSFWGKGIAGWYLMITSFWSRRMTHSPWKNRTLQNFHPKTNKKDFPKYMAIAGAPPLTIQMWGTRGGRKVRLGCEAEGIMREKNRVKKSQEPGKCKQLLWFSRLALFIGWS